MPHAVFLSYAHEDTDAARRLADALRATGVEVWFDQSELRGGDAWDQNIRAHIRDCALFVPIVSAHTQSRREGYFRLEWKLADERTHLMAEGTPFVLPVVVDDTKERDALVPKSFVNVQWTRLPRAEAPAPFAQRVAQLLGRSSAMESGRPRPVERGEGAAAPTKPNSLPLIFGVVALVAIASAIYFALRPAAREPAPAVAIPAKHVTEKNVALTPPAALMANDKSIAVLPLDNLSPDKENEFFADGIHDEIITRLALIGELRVISRQTVVEYQRKGKTMRQLGQELGVTYVVEGSVQRAGHRVRVICQLIRAATDEHVWTAQPYDKDLTDVFAIQSEISQSIAGALHTVLSPQEKALVERRPTENPAAYDLYLKAGTATNPAFLGMGIDVRLFRQRETLLRQAVELDPKFAEAWGSLAAVHAYFYGSNEDRTTERLAQAKTAIERALSLAPDSPSVIRSVASYYLDGYHDYACATEQVEKLVRLQPNDSGLHAFLGSIQKIQGRWPEAIVSLRKAAQLDPSQVDAARRLAQTLRQCRRFDEAIVEQRRLVALRPEQIREEVTLASWIDAASGSTREMDQLISRLSAREPDSPQLIAIRKQAASARGDFAEFARLDRLQSYIYIEGDEYRQALDAALIYRALGDRAAARARLEGLQAKLRALLDAQPTNSGRWQDLGLMEALLGHNDEAVRYALKAVEMFPVSMDADRGQLRRVNLAVVYAWTGDKERAIAELKYLLRTPGYTTGRGLNNSVQWFPLRGDPRFEALANDPKNNAPLF